MEKSSSENDSAYAQSINGKEMNLGFKDRLQEIEKDLSTIFERLDKVEEGNTEGMQGRPTDSYEMLVKINSLEREKRDLKDENFALRLEIADHKEIKEKILKINWIKMEKILEKKREIQCMWIKTISQSRGTIEDLPYMIVIPTA